MAAVGVPWVEWVGGRAGCPGGMFEIVGLGVGVDRPWAVRRGDRDFSEESATLYRSLLTSFPERSRQNICCR